jgi:hypothetical protein
MTRIQKIRTNRTNQRLTTIHKTNRNGTATGLSSHPEERRRSPMAAASDIEVLETAFLVGKRRPLADLPTWKRWLVRAIYRFLGYDNGAAVEVQAICTTEELARDVANKPGWFLVELPINVSLPEEPCQFKAHEFPASGVAGQHHRIPLAAVNINQIHALEKQSEDLVRKVRAG